MSVPHESSRRFAGFALLTVFLALFPVLSRAATFTVNSIGDGNDASLNGTCETTNAGECTLRAAIEEANYNSGLDQIDFDITSGCVSGVCTINIGSLLDDITDPIIIDGSTQPGNSGVCTMPISSRPTYAIVLNGSSFYGVKLRLESGSSGSTIRGLSIQGFTDALAIIRSNDNHIECNFVGTDESGHAGPGNNLNGVIIGCSSTGNVIGGQSAADGNLLSGNEYDGVQINGAIPCDPNDPNAPTPDDNYVLGNFIGVEKDGVTPFGNGYSGVSMWDGTGPDGNMVGVMPNGGGGFIYNGNVIGGNGTGVYIGPDVTGAVVAANFIGTDPTGTANIGNQWGGVETEGGPGVVIGGSDPAAKNTIAFNVDGGVLVYGSTAIGNTISRNSTYSNGGLGIDLGDSSYFDGPTANDPGDTDSGPNTLLNFPEIKSAQILGSNLVVQYSVPTPDLPLTVEFFVADSDGQEGKTFIGSATYSASGTTTATLPGSGVSFGDVILATATDTAGNTSEFSFGTGAVASVTSAPIPTATLPGLIALFALIAAAGIWALRSRAV